MASKKDAIYQCLSPVGNQEPVDMSPIAPRLKSLDGKTIHLSICGEPDITIPLEKRLRADYPNVNWKQKKTYTISPVMLSQEEMKTADAVLQAVCW